MGIVWTLGVGLNACKEGDTPLPGTAGGDVVGEWQSMGWEVVDIAHRDATLKAKITDVFKNSDWFQDSINIVSYRADHTMGVWDDDIWYTGGIWNDNGNIYAVDNEGNRIPGWDYIFYIQNDILTEYIDLLDEPVISYINGYSCDEETMDYVYKNSIDELITFRDLKFTKFKLAHKFSRVQSN